MAFRAISRYIGCANCYSSLLDTRGLVNQALPRTSQLIKINSLAFRAPLSSGNSWRSVTSDKENDDAFTNNIVSLRQGGQENSERLGTHTDNFVPWYLQATAPPRAPQVLSERQRVPDLPERSPPILKPLLHHLSVDLGLDSLSLLDLRELDPPPALGANLLMIISTARSVKHLHVAAGELCRWLRGGYKLRPEADGLLGRNELKLKLRRKARRAKLLGNVSDDSGDDGIHTGWICVDAGMIESAEVSENVAEEAQKFVGFGTRTDKTRIVVQLLTEDKREEIELEKLWEGILRRNLTTQTEGW